MIISFNIARALLDYEIPRIMNYRLAKLWAPIGQAQE